MNHWLLNRVNYVSGSPSFTISHHSSSHSAPGRSIMDLPAKTSKDRNLNSLDRGERTLTTFGDATCFVSFYACSCMVRWKRPSPKTQWLLRSIEAIPGTSELRLRLIINWPNRNILSLSGGVKAMGTWQLGVDAGFRGFVVA